MTTIRWLTCAAAISFVLVFLCAGATAAWAEDGTSSRQAQWAHLSQSSSHPAASPAADGRTEWRACRLDPAAARFVQTADGQPCQAPCYPAEPIPMYVQPCPRGCAPRKRCEWRIGILGWLPGMDGTLTMGGQRNTVDFDWTDWFDNLDKVDSAFQGFVGYRYDRWWAELYGMFMTLGDAVPVEQAPGVAVDTKIGITVLKGLVGYDVWRSSLSTANRWPCLITSMYGGVRYYSLSVDATLGGVAGRPGRVLNETQDWLDPLVGMRLWLDVSRCWALFLDADVGGFGVGSDLSWGVRLAAQWRPINWFAVQAGWNILDVDYTTGAGADLFVFDMNMSGPFLGFVFHL